MPRVKGLAGLAAIGVQPANPEFTAASVYALVNGQIVADADANALTIAVKTLSGADPSPSNPVYVSHRGASAAGDDYYVSTIEAALSLTIPQGVDFATEVNKAFRGWLTIIDDDGALRIAAFRASNINSTSRVFYALPEFGLASTTDPFPDNAGVFYAGAGVVVTSKPYRIIGFFEYDGLATPGQWSAEPDEITLYRAGIALPGEVLQIRQVTDTFVSTNHLLIPLDTSIPQITEGQGAGELKITPQSPANMIEHEFRGLASIDSADNTGILALFRDGAANAVAATWFTSKNGSSALNVVFPHQELANTSSEITYNLRSGLASAGTLCFNGDGTTQSSLLGGKVEKLWSIVERQG